MFPCLFPLASPSLPPSLSHPSRWSQTTELISLCYAAAREVFLKGYWDLTGGQRRLDNQAQEMGKNKTLAKTRAKIMPESFWWGHCCHHHWMLDLMAWITASALNIRRWLAQSGCHYIPQKESPLCLLLCVNDFSLKVWRGLIWLVNPRLHADGLASRQPEKVSGIFSFYHRISPL